MNSCVKAVAIVVAPNNCDCSVNWNNAPGTCRLRIQGYFNGMFGNCPGQTGSFALPWDGTLPIFLPGVPQYQWDTSAAPLSITGKQFFGANLPTALPGNYTIAIFGDNGGIGATLWSGTRVDPCILGVYTNNGLGCLAAPATITLEGYTP